MPVPPQAKGEYVTIMSRTSSPTQNRIEDRNFFHLMMDVWWFGLALTATSRFLSVFAIRLGASEFEQSLLVSLQGLVMGVATFFVLRWRKRFQNTRRSIDLPGLFFRFWFLLPIFTPLFPAAWQIPWLLGSVAFVGFAQGLAGPLFSVHMREAVGDRRVNALSSRRFAAMNLGLCVTSLAFGWLLTVLPFPVNYQVMFALAFFFSLISQWHVTRSQTLYPVEAAPADQPKTPVWRLPGWGIVIAAGLLTHLGFMSMSALIPTALVSELRADEAYMGVFGLLELMGGVAAGLTGEWFLRHLSPRRLAGVSVGVTAITPLIIALAPSLNIALTGAFINGLGWSLVSIALYALLVERTPGHAMTSAMMLHHQVLAVGTFVGPMIGSALVGLNLDLMGVMLVGAGLRLAAGVALSVTLRVRRRVAVGQAAPEPV